MIPTIPLLTTSTKARTGKRRRERPTGSEKQGPLSGVMIPANSGTTSQFSVTAILTCTVGWHIKAKSMWQRASTLRPERLSD